jgi:hypothetical protein
MEELHENGSDDDAFLEELRISVMRFSNDNDDGVVAPIPPRVDFWFPPHTWPLVLRTGLSLPSQIERGGRLIVVENVGKCFSGIEP